MYIPRYFEITDPLVIEQFIKENSFATIVSTGTEFPIATHIPIELEKNENGENVLWGHVSKANPQWKLFEKNENVLVIFFSSAHHYISSSWYGKPNVPTWNYMSVHVSGKIKLIEGEKLWESVRRLTDKYEKNAANPVSLDTLPKEVQKQMNGLVGFEILISKMEAAFKLSQNRNEEDFENIIKHLNLSPDLHGKLTAEAMRKQRSEKE